MKKNKWYLHPAFYIVIILYFILGFSTLLFGEKWGNLFFLEDTYFENVGALSLGIAAVISFYVFVLALKNRKTTNFHWFKLLVYLGLAFLYFFGAGEEISWGQRIFNIPQPEVLADENVQEELNIHNLAVFEDSDLLKADNIFTVFWVGFAVLLPALSLASKSFREFIEKLTPIVHWDIGLLFIFNYLAAQLAKPIFHSFYSYKTITFTQAVQEVKESNYEVLFIFLSLAVLWDLHRLIQDKAAAPAKQN